MSIYTDEGYKNRRDYLEQLADDFGVDPMIVFQMASILGSSEDFDGLILELEVYDYGVIYDDWDEDVTDEILDEGEDNEN